MKYKSCKFIINSIKDQVTHNSNLTDYIDFCGRGKELPISYSTFEKTFLALFVNAKTILSTNINYREEGLNPRLLEHEQLIKLCNILAEEIYEKNIKAYFINTGNTTENVPVLAEPINYMEMIKK